MRTAMIWGANGGMGRAVVSHLVANNWTVVAITHQATKLDNLTPHVIDANVADPFEVQLAVNNASQLVSEVNLWLYAAGDITSRKVADMPFDDWQRILNANLTGAYLTTHHSLPLLATDAHLMYLGAVSERLQLPNLAAYAVAKAGLEAFVEVVRKEERKRRVSLVRPGAVDTPLWEKVPLRLPNNAFTPFQIARQILDAYEQGHTGTLDI
jgi:NAD(P)-dependent dehydrogenase (short-subunit alcohol dehydrogenase family)